MGRGSLNNLTGTPGYISWMTGILRPVPSGYRPRDWRRHWQRGWTADGEASSLRGMRTRPALPAFAAEPFSPTPNVSVMALDPDDPHAFTGLSRSTESALCLNVLEYAEDPARTLAGLREALLPGGVLLILVPQGRSLFGSVDRTLGHKRRFDLDEMNELLSKSGLDIVRAHHLNKIGKPAWWFYGKVLGRKQINKLTLKCFDKTVWLWKRIEGIFPWKGLSLIIIARRVD